MARVTTQALEPYAASQLALELARDTAKWKHLVRHDPEQRVFAPLDAGQYAGAWLICWMPGHDTGFHDHDHSAGAVTVVSGQVREERIASDWRVTGTTYEAGDVFSFVSGDIHRMLHVGDEPAISIHVYSPKLHVMGAYAFGSGGMQRHLLGPDQELKPIQAAG
jgi:quercetin dioxygenase-like cupin family protein